MARGWYVRYKGQDRAPCGGGKADHADVGYDPTDGEPYFVGCCGARSCCRAGPDERADLGREFSCGDGLEYDGRPDPVAVSSVTCPACRGTLSVDASGELIPHDHVDDTVEPLIRPGADY